MANPHDDFFASKPLPAAPPVGAHEAPAAVSPRAKPRSVFTTYVLPVMLFVIVIGGVAWLSQNLSGTSKRPSVPNPTPTANNGPGALVFDRNKAEWEESRLNEKGEPLDPYVKEWEKGETGYYDFPFRNTTDQVVELGFSRPSCDCTSMQVAILDADQAEKAKQVLAADRFAASLAPDKLQWADLKVSETESFLVPPKAEGVLRMNWSARKEPGSRLRLSVQMWSQPQGKQSQRVVQMFEVPIVVVYPAIMLDETVNVGVLGPKGTAEGKYFIWSPTRENMKLTVEHPDPLLEVKLTKKSADECKKYEEKFRNGNRPTRVKAAYEVTVEVHEEKGDKKMDLGPFTKKAVLKVEDSLHEVTPTVVGLIRGEVEVGPSEDRGRVNLKTFRTASGTSVKVPVWTEVKAPLEIASVNPPALQAKLIKPKDESASRPRWTLELSVPPNKWEGSFNEDAVIMLKLATDPPRLIRVPIAGTATER